MEEPVREDPATARDDRRRKLMAWGVIAGLGVLLVVGGTATVHRLMQPPGNPGDDLFESDANQPAQGGDIPGHAPGTTPGGLSDDLPVVLGSDGRPLPPPPQKTESDLDEEDPLLAPEAGLIPDDEEEFIFSSPASAPGALPGLTGSLTDQPGTATLRP